MNKLLTIAAALAPVAVYAAAPQANGKEIVEGINKYITADHQLKSPPHFTYLPDGQHYALLSKDGRTIDSYDIKTGQKTGALIDLSDVRETEIPDIEGFIIGPDAKRIIVYRNVSPIYRRSFKAEYYVYDSHSRRLTPLSKEFKQTQIPKFSPNGRMIAFVADNDIYVKKCDYNTEVRVTEDGAPGKIINGATDWVYEEEFYTTSTLAWAPDNTVLCYLKFNETDVPMYSLPLYEGTCESMPQYALYPGELSYKYPVAGEPNSVVSLYSYDIDNRKIKQIPLADKTIEYIPRIDFGNTAQRLMVSTLNRDQNRYEMYSVNPMSAVSKSVFVEKSNAWIAPETFEQLTFDNDGFVVMSNRSGRMHLYKYNYTGSLVSTLTHGDFDVTAYYGHDALGNHYCQTATPTPMDRQVQRIDAKKGLMTAISQKQGTNSATFAPNRDYAVLRHNSLTEPNSFILCTSAGKQVRVLADNSEYGKRMQASMPQREFIKVPSDGRELNGWIMRPRDFNPAKKYPVIMTQYSGPGSQEVLNKWGIGWEQYFADNGFIVVCVDGRGTGCRGNEFMYSVYKNLGHYETIDQINAARYVATLPGVDADAIGMFGWSYGGYETLMCVTNKNNPFAAAVAVAPVTDWRYYDTVYAERYMLTPQQNDQGYNVSAPLKAAENLTGKLMIMYGTADDNVHPVNSLQMASALQYHGLLFDMMVFPNKNHSIYGCLARAIVYGNMFRHFRNTLCK